VLRLGGYDVVEAHDGESAAECLRLRSGDGNDPFAAIVSDVIMPRGGGARVLDAVKQYAPSARLLWVTGHPGLGMDHDQSHAPSDDPLLQKPWTATELLSRVRAVIEDPRERLQIS
jgi:DNA-binding NtrC family response regulator